MAWYYARTSQSWHRPCQKGTVSGEDHHRIKKQFLGILYLSNSIVHITNYSTTHPSSHTTSHWVDRLTQISSWVQLQCASKNSYTQKEESIIWTVPDLITSTTCVCTSLLLQLPTHSKHNYKLQKTHHKDGISETAIYNQATTQNN
jgi:hypothetical protein